MSLSNSVLHRYTPPTCTLQVVAYSSPVSRWVGTKVVKEVQFDLRFDDPTAPAAKQFNITGDRDRLEALHIAVTNYIQELLTLSPESFATLGQETPSSPPSVDVETDVWSMPMEELPPATAKFKPAIAQGDLIVLKPATQFSHNLFLGSLATVETGKFIQLSVLQLFDLATALDDYARDLIALPTTTYSSNIQPSSVPTAWANIAAVLLLAVGGTAVGLNFFNRPNSPQVANSLNNRPQTTNSPTIAIAPAPFPTISPAGTLTPPPKINSNSTTTTAIVVPTKSPVTQVVTPTNQATPAANVPPQPIVINPLAAGQTPSTITIPRASSPQAPTITIPGATTRPVAIVPPIAAIPSPNLQTNSTSDRAASNAPVAETRETTKPATPRITATRTASVPNPQLVEVSNYFNQRWEPPASLKSSLEYSIILDVDGTIQVIEPYGLPARTYLDRTGMPLIGERFVSANQDGQSPRIRLRFNPNGKVQAFLEVKDAR